MARTSLTVTIKATEVPAVIAALEKASALAVTARAVVDFEWRAWWREGEEVGTVSLSDLDGLLERIAALREALAVSR